VLGRGCVNLVPLLERLELPRQVSAGANPKSSTGRLDVFTRVIGDRARGFDTLPAGYSGPLYLEISPRTFPVRVRYDSLRNADCLVDQCVLALFSFAGDDQIVLPLAFDPSAVTSPPLDGSCDPHTFTHPDHRFATGNPAGMVGLIGGILGDADVNIAGMQVSRQDKGGAALVALSVDSAIPSETLTEIEAAMQAASVRAVDLS